VRVAVVHNQDTSGVINVFGMQNRERYNPKTVERVAEALEAGGHTVRVIDGNMHVIEQLQDFMPKVVTGERPGMVFNMAYGIQGVSRYTHLPAMLEMLGVPYVGSGPQAHGLALDKVTAKMVFDAEGIPTPRYWNFASPDMRFDDLEFPVIVKPKMEAVSYGIKVVHDWDQLHQAVTEIMGEFDQHVLVEEFVPGREFAVGLLGNGPPEVLPIVEIDFEGDADAIQTAGDKLRKPREKLCPAPLEEEKAEELRELAQRSFSSLGLNDFARIDVRMDGEGRFYVLEINSMASLGLTGTYVHAAKVAGYDYAALINRMLDVAAVRYFGETYFEEREQVAARGAAPPKLSTQVRKYLRSQQGTTEALLRKMVGMRTPATDAEPVDALGDLVHDQLRRLGFERDVHALPDVGNALYFWNHGEGDPDVLLLGNLDSYPGVRFQRYRAESRRLHGTGIAEHKGGLAVAISALKALRFARRLKRCRVGILLTTDDALGGARCRGLVERHAERAGTVLGLKAGDADGGVLLSRSGRATYHAELVVRAETPPSAELAASIATAMCRQVSSLQKLSDPEGGVYVAVPVLELANNFQQLPEKASMTVSARFNDAAVGDELDGVIRGSFKRAPKGARFHVRGGMRRPPRETSEQTEELYERVGAIADTLNVRVRPAHRWHSADICFVPREIAGLDGLGPLGASERTDDEHVLRGSLVDRAAVLALTIDSICRRH
jgi:D-alanine-D-alanine ligase